MDERITDISEHWSSQFDYKHKEYGFCREITMRREQVLEVGQLRLRRGKLIKWMHETWEIYKLRDSPYNDAIIFYLRQRTITDRIEDIIF